jgi:FkbM family methyltransferase
LANGLQVHGWSETEVKVLSFELFDCKSYIRHGVQLKDGMTIFDIGANVGLFSVWLLTNFKNLNVKCFEPIPKLHEIARRNLVKFSGKSNSKFEIFRLGLSNTNVDTIEFTFDPQMTVASSLFEAQLEEDSKMSGKLSDVPKLCYAMVADAAIFGLIPKPVSQFICVGLSIPVIQWLFTVPVALYLLSVAMKRNSGKEKVQCTLKRLSEVLEQMDDVSKIDLVKIDVEGAEFDVLKGIDDKHLAMVDQMVIEVHDVGNTRVKEIVEYLETRGFKKTVVDQELLELHKIMKIFTVYATR